MAQAAEIRSMWSPDQGKHLEVKAILWLFVNARGSRSNLQQSVDRQHGTRNGGKDEKSRGRIERLEAMQDREIILTLRDGTHFHAPGPVLNFYMEALEDIGKIVRLRRRKRFKRPFPLKVAVYSGRCCRL